MIGEGEHIINVLKEIEVTDSYLGIDLDFRKCQNKEPYYNCTTRTYIDTILSECGCLPFNIRMSNKVKDLIFFRMEFTESSIFACILLGTSLLIKTNGMRQQNKG